MKERFAFRLDKNLKEQLKKEAKERDMTLTAYIKLIIAERKKTK